jgi:hypothetical protein
LWNTRYLEVALADIGTPDEIARHVAPLGWEHISLTGDYSWNVEDRPDPDALRPLRRPIPARRVTFAIRSPLPCRYVTFV